MRFNNLVAAQACTFTIGLRKRCWLRITVVWHMVWVYGLLLVMQAALLASEFSGHVVTNLAECSQFVHVVISTLPAVAFDDAVFAASVSCLLSRDKPVVFDVVYRPAVTTLLRLACDAGCHTTIHGLEMLLHQACAQFEAWTGFRAPLDAMKRAAYDALDESKQ
jgi:shikimate 5-dehydrogenase